MPAYNMKDYVTVAERLQAAQHDLTSVMADPPVMITNSMGYIRVVVVLQDGRSATGTASFRLDLQGKGAQATNPLEDAETSAVGRALGMLGYGSKGGIASREEVEEAQRREAASYQPRQQPQPRTNGHHEPATEKQRAMLKALRNDLGWTNEDFTTYVEGINLTVDGLDKRTASQIIDGMQKLKAAQEFDAIEAEG